MDRKYLLPFWLSIAGVAIALNACVFAYVFHRLSLNALIILVPMIFVLGVGMGVWALLRRKRAVLALSAPQRAEFDHEQLPRMVRAARLLKYWLIYLPFGMLLGQWQIRELPLFIRAMSLLFGALFFTFLYRARRTNLQAIDRIRNRSNATA